MKKEKYLLKAKHIKKLRAALSVLLLMVFIPLLLANGILFYQEISIKQGQAPAVINAKPAVVHASPITQTSTRGDNSYQATTQEETLKEETATIDASSETQGTVHNDSSTASQTQSQTSAVTTTVKPATTQAAATKPPVTQPAATKPPVTQPPVSKPPATQPPTTQPPLTTKPAVTSNTPCIHLDTDEQTMLNLINQERKSYGLSELKLDTRLKNVAQTKCRELIQLNYFAHQSPVYGSPFDMIRYFGITFAKAGENLAMNTCVESAHDALMNSDAHRKAIMSPDYTHVGIGAYQGVSGKYYVQMFTCS